MLIKHSSPQRSARVNQVRDQKIAAGFEWEGATFQTGAADLRNVAGRVGKITAKLALSESVPDFTWRSADNQDVQFTAEGFLRFAIALDEWVEQQYQASWQLKGGS